MPDAIAVLRRLPGPRVAVLGGMLETGPRHEAVHRSIAAELVPWVDRLVSVGEGGELIARSAADAGLPAERIVAVPDAAAAAPAALGGPAGGTVLLKGPRALGLSQVGAGAGQRLRAVVPGRAFRGGDLTVDLALLARVAGAPSLSPLMSRSSRWTSRSSLVPSRASADRSRASAARSRSSAARSRSSASCSRRSAFHSARRPLSRTTACSRSSSSASPGSSPGLTIAG